MNKQQNTVLRGSVFFIMTMIMAVGFLITIIQPSRAGDVTRIVVVPFTLNAGEDMGFLQRGIVEMLISRLGKENKVLAIKEGSPEEDLAVLAKRTEADYVVIGSVTVLGNRISTDAQVVKGTAVNTPVISFGRAGRQQEEVIDHIDALAAVINERLFSHSKGRSVQSKVVESKAATTQASEQERTATRTTSAPHPAGDDQPFIARKDVMPVLPQLELPGDIKGQLNGIAAGDVDGDGTAEIVTITADFLLINKRERGRWIKLAEYKNTGAFVGVDVADVNGNGRQEIFVTNFNNMDNWVRSFVLEWDGKALQQVAEELSWYFRAVDLPSKGKVLVGQQQSVGERFGKGIFKMVWEDDAYKPGEQLSLPDQLNIFGFAYGAVRAADTLDVVVHKSNGYIQILKRSGDEVWTSNEQYGGTKNAIVFKDEMQWDSRENVYLLPRVHLQDLDGDGVQEILVINNGTNTGTEMVKHRFYTKGHLEWLKWRDGRLRSILSSSDVSEFIADSTLVDIDADGRPEVVAAVVKKESGLMAKGAGRLLVFGTKSD